MELGGTFLLKNLIKLAARMMHGGDYPECVRVHRGSVSAALDRPAAWRALQPCEPLRHPRRPPRVRLPHQPRFTLPDAHFGARAWAGGRACRHLLWRFRQPRRVDQQYHGRRLPARPRTATAAAREVRRSAHLAEEAPGGRSDYRWARATAHRAEESAFHLDLWR